MARVLQRRPAGAKELTVAWRKRVGVEPTRPGVSRDANGFEVREGHRTPCASAGIMDRIAILAEVRSTVDFGGISTR